MDIYIVSYYNWDYNEIVNVFRTEKEAEAFINSPEEIKDREWEDCDYKIDHWII